MWAVVEIGASQVNSMQECQSDHSSYNNRLTLWGHFSKYKIGLIDTLAGSHTYNLLTLNVKMAWGS